MIGQTMINVRASGARTRISTFPAGVFLLVLVVGFGDVVARIPMAALVAVMVMVSFGTFDWHSVAPATLRRMPRSETTVMVATVVVTVATHNLAIGVVAGVLVAMVLFARRVAHLATVERELVEQDGEPCASTPSPASCSSPRATTSYAQFHYADDPERIVIDLSRSHVWDASTVAALDAISTKYAPQGQDRRHPGAQRAQPHMHGRLSGELPCTDPAAGDPVAQPGPGAGRPQRPPDEDAAGRTAAPAGPGRCRARTPTVPSTYWATLPGKIATKNAAVARPTSTRSAAGPSRLSTRPAARATSTMPEATTTTSASTGNQPGTWARNSSRSRVRWALPVPSSAIPSSICATTLVAACTVAARVAMAPCCQRAPHPRRRTR